MNQLQKNIEQLMINLASAQARHKEDAHKMEESEASLRHSQARVTALEQLTEQQIQDLNKFVHIKEIQVGNFIF